MGEKRIVGRSVVMGLGITCIVLTDFWHDVRKSVEAGLIDLELFIETAEDKDVNKVLNRETLKPVVEAFLWHPVVEQAKPDLARAEIAQLFIRVGFDYLSSMRPSDMTKAHQDTVNQAIDLSNWLVDRFKPESERRYIINDSAVDRLK